MKPIYSGHAHEIYDISDKHFIIVKTDRISALNNIVPVAIRNKGVMLNKISNFWFHRTKHIINNHIVEENVDNMPGFFQSESFFGRAVMVQKLKIIPFEFIVRGYIFGRMWRAYQNEESFCGRQVTGEYKLAQKLKKPVVTPTTKCDGGYDECVDIKYIEAHLGAKMTQQIIDICLSLYKECSEYAFSRGLIIADTKFEFGLDKHNKLVLADEILTPDSSRFWDVSDYEVGHSPKSYDKQLIRDWLLNNKINEEFQYDKIPKGIITRTEQIYHKCLERLVP